MSEKNPPDFAMLRAVEILAQVYETQRERPIVPPPPIDRPIVLANERVSLGVGTTTRDAVEAAFGIAFRYPIAGWHTYAAREDGKRNFLSLFYRERILIAVEYYVPKVDRAPSLAARDYGAFRLSPGDVALRSATAAIDARFTPAVGGPAPVVYAQALECRFPGGLAYVMANAGTVERITLYGDATPTDPKTARSAPASP